MLELELRKKSEEGDRTIREQLEISHKHQSVESISHSLKAEVERLKSELKQEVNCKQ